MDNIVNKTIPEGSIQYINEYGLTVHDSNFTWEGEEFQFINHNMWQISIRDIDNVELRNPVLVTQVSFEEAEFFAKGIFDKMKTEHKPHAFHVFEYNTNQA